jgi:hypothetical protein
MGWVHVREGMPCEGQTVLIATAGRTSGTSAGARGGSWSLCRGAKKRSAMTKSRWRGGCPCRPHRPGRGASRGRRTVKVPTWSPSGEGGEDATDPLSDESGLLTRMVRLGGKLRHPV